MERLISLDDERARDPGLVGTKASGLARARSAGLPVPKGWVVPVEAGTDAMRVGADALARSGPAAAVLAIVEQRLEDGVLAELRSAGRDLGPRTIVRSSAEQESDPRWAGAFASYTEVHPDDLATAVRGCWSSAFSRDALQRCDAMRTRPDELRMAVLLQRWIAFEGGGTAEVGEGEHVRVTTLRGSPQALVGGRADGVVTEVGRDGAVTGDQDLAGLGTKVLHAVADLARAAKGETGDASIEWGVRGADVVLLQLRTVAAASRTAATFKDRQPKGLLPPIAERLAVLAARFPAPLGDQLVIPWALALGNVPGAPSIPVPDPEAALAEAQVLAAKLTAQAWASGPTVGERDAERTIRSVLGPDPGPGLARMSALCPVDHGVAMRLLGLVAGIGRTLVERRLLPFPESVWRLTPDELARTLGRRGATVPERLGPDRWEPFLFGVASANGRALTGMTASPGAGAGRLQRLEGPPSGWRVGPRDVLAVGDAVPHVAPLLWNASGLVAARGSVGAHLFEVSRSLGVPAVVGVALPPQAEGSLVSVDGNAGIVSVLEARDTSLARVGA